MRVENVFNFLGQGVSVNPNKDGDFLAILLQVIDETLGYKENNLIGKQGKELKELPQNFNFSPIPGLERILKEISDLPLKGETFTENSKKDRIKHKLNQSFSEILLFLNQFVKLFNDNEGIFLKKNEIQNSHIPDQRKSPITLSEGVLKFERIYVNNKEKREEFVNSFKGKLKFKEIDFPDDKSVIKDNKPEPRDDAKNSLELPILTNNEKGVYRKQVKKVNNLSEIWLTQEKVLNREERIKNKKGKEFKPSPGVVVELKEWKREELPKVQGSERIFSIKDVKVFEGNEKKSVSVKLEGLGIQMSFIKDNVNLKINLNQVLKNFFFTPYDAVKVSQILSSYGFRLESVNVNGSEIYRNREREKVNIKVNELMGEGINSFSPDGNISVLL